MPSMPTVALRSIRSFYVGGQCRSLSDQPLRSRSMVLRGAPRLVDPNGDYVLGQMYVQAFRLARPRSALPVLLWHGGGMTGSHWESTPGGGEGWLWRFLRAGYDTLVSDAVERGRSSWAMYPQLYAEPPFFRTKNEAWEMFRIGPPGGYRSDPRLRIAHRGQQFPVECFDDFAKQWVPRWAGHEDMALHAYGALVQQTGPCVIVAHSQGAGYAAAVAQRFPDIVRAVVVIEPGGMPAYAGRHLPPHLFVWGDHFGPCHPIWSRYRGQAESYATEAGSTGNRMDVLDLPATGLRGNSHFIMLDRNNACVFERLLAWLRAHGC
ncbi:esterase [Cupriavidus sp. USMAHM13]|nr:esterase [Cupriavidus sp. USMAHM13]